MKYFKILIILLLSTQVFSQSGMFKIMTYNIHHGADADDQLTIDAMRKYIKRSGASIVGLQEVDSVCERSGKMDEPKILARGSKLKSYFTRHFPFQGGAYGQALLTKCKVLKVENKTIPVYPESEGKSVSMLLADISIDRDLVITVAVVHLDYRNKSSRQQQIDLVINLLQKIVHPVILLGDFNAFHNSEEIDILRQEFTLFPIANDAYTFPAKNPDRRIDFIFISKNAPFKVITEKIDSVPYSDHLPLIATIKFFRDE
ncbi:MAG: endonuclease/exonuclease/phosphatase family protein [Saprospiraceae bacterium]|nr:endonuclease/exonuclease/phosphatase family protein [Saprospiraceae bacterium]